MIKVYQTKFSDKNGNKGNCFRACISSLLEIDMNIVPEFESIENWHDAFFEFLYNNGLEYEGIGKIENINEYDGIDGYNIVFGQSLREYVKNGHSVIFYKDKISHDPHPSNEGLKTIDGFYMIRKIK